MRQSTSEHLVSDVPLGIWLSGGVDSSTILHYAAQASSARLKTFSISFDGRSFDETPYIKAVVAAYGTEHEQLDLNPEQDLEGAIQEFAYYSDEPSADAGALPVWFLSKMCKARTTVALSGEGADELFGGYLTYRANDYAKLLRKFPRPALQIALSALRRMPVSDEKIGLEYKLKRLLEGSLMSPARAHVYWNGTFSEQGKESLMAGDFPRAMNELLYGPDGDNGRRNGLGSYLRFDQQYYLADDILVKSDRMSMAHSVEVRPPFLDHRIIEFAATLAPALKIRGSKQKFLLKEAMRDKLPQAVLTRKKMGFDIPAHDWFRGILRPMLVDTLNTGLAEYPSLFRADEVNRLLREHQREANQRRISPLGIDDPVPMDEEMAYTAVDVDVDAATTTTTRGNRDLYLIVILCSVLIYLACIISPPHLQDDVDAVQAQIARNMLASGDWVTARLDGIPFLEKPPLIYWTDSGLLQNLRRSRLVGAHSDCAIECCARLADCRVWHLGFRAKSGVICGPEHCHLCRAVSLHPRTDPRRDADVHHRAGDVGVSARAG